MHMFTFLLDDVGIPLNYRHMEGFGVHTFTLLTRDGKVRRKSKETGKTDVKRVSLIPLSHLHLPLLLLSDHLCQVPLEARGGRQVPAGR
jgi:hypothetical protein